MNWVRERQYEEFLGDKIFPRYLSSPHTVSDGTGGQVELGELAASGFSVRQVGPAVRA